jgi:succinate-acetate transporter protein
MVAQPEEGAPVSNGSSNSSSDTTPPAVVAAAAARGANSNLATVGEQMFLQQVGGGGGGVDPFHHNVQQEEEDYAYGYFQHHHHQQSSREQQPSSSQGPPRVRSRINLAALQQRHPSCGDASSSSSLTKISPSPITSAVAVNLNHKTRVVALRYFLDRPGYGLHNSAARLWFDAPAVCTPLQVYEFLKEQQIAMDGLLIEVYLDAIQSFMLLDACEACMVEWDFSDVTAIEPGILNIRLTDLAQAEISELQHELQPPPDKLSKKAVGLAAAAPRAGGGGGGGGGMQLANVTPSGLFSFSMMVGLEMAALTAKLIPGSINYESYILRWGPYMFFVGGLMQILVAIFQVVRNNVYGATAFFGFGCFWFSNGLIEILAGNDPDSAQQAAPYDAWGNFIRLWFILAFCIGLEIQTFAMNKLSSTLIGLLSLKVFFQALIPWSNACAWLTFGVGWATSLFAYYVFLTEFTNQVQDDDDDDDADDDCLKKNKNYT